MMTAEKAEALVLLAMDSMIHHQNCLRDAVRDMPCELLSEALAVMEGAGENVLCVRQWFAKRGVQLPGPQVSMTLARISGQILDYLGRSDEPQTRVEIEAHVRGKTAHKRMALKSLCTTRKVVESGAGSKGDPLRYDLARTRGQESQKPS